MATWSPLTTNFAVNLQDSSSRGGVRPNAVQNHHTATNNKAVALSLFAPGGRTVTPNYFVAGKEIWGIVPEERRAWTSGSAYDDTRAVTIETLNSTNAPNWQFAADTMATLVRLNADIARRYGIPFRHAINGIYEHKNLYQWYGRSYATACAGPSFNINHVISAARKVGSNTKPEVKDIEMRTIFNKDDNNNETRRAAIGEVTFHVQGPGASALERKFWGQPVSVSQSEWDSELVMVNDRRAMAGLKPLKGVRGESGDFK